MHTPVAAVLACQHKLYARQVLQRVAPEANVGFELLDADDGGEITFKEFVKLMTQRPCQSDTEEDIERIFQNFDEDNKGFISA